MVTDRCEGGWLLGESETLGSDDLQHKNQGVTGRREGRERG